MGDVVPFQQPMTAVEEEVEKLLDEVESGGAIVCLIENSAGEVTLAFEPWPSNISQDGLSAANMIANRFRDSANFRDALTAYLWSVGGTFVSGMPREVAAK